MPFTDADCLACREDFPSLGRTFRSRPLVYLDGPAGTQVPRRVIDAVGDYYRTSNANTHGAFPTSRDSDARLLEARRVVAAFLGAEDWRCVSFGHNMTTLTYSLAHALGREMEAGDEIVITQLDHEANRGPWQMLEERGMRVVEAAMTRDGRLDEDDLAAKIGERTRLVAVGLASNALGTVNDVARVRDLARATGARLVVDAVHYAPHHPLDAAALAPDFLLCSAYKFYGPHVGILYTRPGLLDRLPADRLRTQEQTAPERFETGTLNHAALVGTAAAVEYLASWGEGEGLRTRLVDAMRSLAVRERGLARFYYEGAARLPGVTVWGPDFAGPRCPTVSITVDGIPPAEVARRLGEEGICVWDGHFYALRPVEVLGLAESGGLVRTGISMYTTREEVDRLLAALGRIAGGTG